MILLRASSARGRYGRGGVRHCSSFSSGDFHDPQWMGFGALRVLNEDRYAPGAGVPPQRRANMELLDIVLTGRLACADGQGGERLLDPGGLHWTGAGHGVTHGLRNPDPRLPARALQACLQPDRLNAAPARALRRFEGEAGGEGWTLLASPDGAEGAIALRLRAWLRAARLDGDARRELALDPARRYWLQVTAGKVHAAGHRLAAGDGLGIAREAGVLAVQGSAGCSGVLLFDLPG